MDALNSDSPEVITTAGFTEFKTTNGVTYKRRKGTVIWKPIQSAPPAKSLTAEDAAYLTLYLVRYYQSPEEPLHWALAISPTQEFGGHINFTAILEVRGDTESMYFNPCTEYVPVSLLPDLHSVYSLTKMNLEDSRKVKEIAELEPPPHAPNRKEIKENCQNWCVRVVQKLVEHNMVDSKHVTSMKELMEPIL
ncbi:uncharacterized protein BDR25DRAFT_230654 [Lindgomyces ingoldianus]|uniref:Uncharacterized protein n=1 Tax=Lindgomyces ingoldianus TaxID=673940 RepID=A0ACB6QNZ5_9PLEO|nr:uncharacterized protein BDR25DRAFT_230654 [Lindgomyces ingoldianus]KAF2468718.1 hypothetical protein BDR25DRAFT_230654 [Lindgomyces ingoldianus]